MSLVQWAWLATLPGLLLTAAGVGRRAGIASVPGPLLMLALGLAWLCGDRLPVETRFPDWLPGVAEGAFALRVDGLAAVMLCVVGAVSACVYAYSFGYLDHDPGRRRYFVFLDGFVLCMGLLVTAATLPLLLFGWAGVGLASFLLIAFWWERPGNLGAGLQAIAANAIGDGALIAAIALLPAGAGDVAQLAAGVPEDRLEWIAALLVIAAAAKSAQGPLYFWLPSAMAGPTPVSALIHAATMVAAGVYLLVRAAPLLAVAPHTARILLWVAAVTSVLAALASLRQDNLKRGLAYSTVSQLGLMFAATGVIAPFAAMFHLVTHAASKALLFLSAGVVIHAKHGEERLDELRGMRAREPVAAAAFLIGALSLVGVPFITAGAFSKDAILDAAVARAPFVGWTLVAASLLTGLYTGRLYFAVFGGGPPAADAHPSGPALRWPLLPLALGALGLGFLAWPHDALGEMLALGTTEHVAAWSTVGAVAGGLGLLGFALSALLARGALRTAPARGGWVDATAGLAHRIASAVAGWHDGRLGRSVFTAALGVAALVLWALRTSR
jgi:NADH-quinone oxidoreductase subunit L